jgi:hypothetical protein
MINGVRVRCSTVELSPTHSPQKWDQRRALDLLPDGTCLKSIVKQLPALQWLALQALEQRWGQKKQIRRWHRESASSQIGMLEHLPRRIGRAQLTGGFDQRADTERVRDN